jgi:hypothetical protein
VRDLIDAFCEQMKSPILEKDLADQVVKNLAFMTKIVNRVQTRDLEDTKVSLKHDLNIDWLIKKVIREAKYELVNKPKETIKVNNLLLHDFQFLFQFNGFFLTENLYIQMDSFISIRAE